ncbi:MAG: pyridoxal-phosphate dependent enzyme, partial [Firmicutes bacterium]|nr:pyridoxal-phosphate dependent enzyme [Bacillota bacterium]
QSNHAMLTAACCNKLGMTPILILKKRGVTDRKGNILLEYLMNTDVRFLDTGDSADVYREMDRVGQESGKVYYKIPTGGSNALGALGYVNCVKEISEQTDIKFDYICCAEGSGGTHAGVAMGAKLFMPNTKVIGMMVDTDPFEEITTNIMKGLAELLELDFVPTVDDVHLVDVCGAGYAIPSPEGNAAIRMMAENEGLFLDPVYTGKAFGGLIQMAREGKFGPDDNILYLYSGGAGGLFAIDVNLD